jgi:hypothetical protein
MTIEDIERYIIRYNLNIASRKPADVYQRMFLYAYLYHHYKWTLKRISNLFNKKDHVTIRHALIEAETYQHYPEFIDATALLMQQTRFIIPTYKVAKRNQVKQKKTLDKFTITVRLSKEKYINYLKTKDEELIYDVLWDIFTKNIKYVKK